MAITRHTTRSKDHVLGRALIHYTLFTHLDGVFLPWVVLTTQGPNLNDNITKIAVHFLMASRIFTNYFGIENYKHNNLSTFNIHWRNLMPLHNLNIKSDPPTASFVWQTICIFVLKYLQRNLNYFVDWVVTKILGCNINCGWL